ncbi:MAG: 50S ribosomal protein L18Ae [Thermoplasmata archaeon]
MKAFRVAGRFRMGSSIMRFEKEVVAEGREGAEEKVFKELGSKHRAKRHDIRVERVEELAPEQVSDASVRMLLMEK